MDPFHHRVVGKHSDARWAVPRRRVVTYRQQSPEAVVVQPLNEGCILADDGAGQPVDEGKFPDVSNQHGPHYTRHKPICSIVVFGLSAQGMCCGTTPALS